MNSQQPEDISARECDDIAEPIRRSEETEVKHSKCDSCMFENIIEEAVSFCMDCSEQLCSNCAREHRKNKSSRHHNLLESEDITNDILVIKYIKEMMTCPDHPEVTVTYKCEDHERYICVCCLAEHHRKCSEIKEISKVNTPENDDVYASVKEAFTQVKEVTASSKIISEENIASLRSQLVVIQSELQSLFNGLHEQLSQTERKLKSETDELVSKELLSSEKTLQKCNEAEAEEMECTKVLEFIQKHGNAREMNIIPDLILKKAKLLSEAFEKESTKNRKSLKFEKLVDLEAVSHFAKISIISEGWDEKVEMNSNLCASSDEILVPDDTMKTVPKSNIRVTTLQCTVSTQTDEVVHEHDDLNICKGTGKSSDNNSENISLMTRNLSQQGIAYNVRCSGDRLPCSIYAIENLSDERIVLIDYKNKKLKVFDQDISLTNTVKFNLNPIDLCNVQDTTYAVAFQNDTSVEMYNIGKGHIVRTGAFQTKFNIVAIEKFGNNGYIAVLFEENERNPDERWFIQIRHAKTGRIYESFHFEKIPNVPFRFTNDGCKRMLCNETDEVFISDNCMFHCFNTDADHNFIQESWYYKSCTGRLLQRITDLSDDNEGNIYVCGYDSHNVHQISKDNREISRIIVSNIKQPLSVSVNSKKGFIIIGCDDDNFIHVYHFL